MNLPLLLALCLAIPTFGCSRKEVGPSSKKARVGFITNAPADFWTFARKGCEKAIAELPNLELDFRITSDNTSAEQRRIIDDLLARGVDGVIISPLDPVNQKPIINTLCQDMPVITTDSDMPDSKRSCYVGTDNVAAGRQAGQLIKDLLPDGGKIMLFAPKPDIPNVHGRLQGIRDALAGSHVEIIDLRTDDMDKVRGKANVTDAMTRHSDLKCCVGLCSYNGPVILNAVADTGKLGQMKIVCFDEEEATLLGVRDGHIYATVVQQPFEFGYQSVKIMADIMKGDKAKIPPDKLIIVPTLVIKQKDAAGFLARVNQLLGKSS